MSTDSIYGFIPKLTSVYGVGGTTSAAKDPLRTWLGWVMYKLPNGKHKQLAKQNPDEFVKQLIDWYDAVIVLVIGGEVSVFSSRRRPKLPVEFLEKIKSEMAIRPHQVVGWYRSLDAQPVEAIAADILFRMEPEDVEHEKSRPTSTPLHRDERARMRSKFWGRGGYDPTTAPDIVDKLLQ